MTWRCKIFGHYWDGIGIETMPLTEEEKETINQKMKYMYICLNCFTHLAKTINYMK